MPERCKTGSLPLARLCFARLGLPWLTVNPPITSGTLRLRNEQRFQPLRSPQISDDSVVQSRIGSHDEENCYEMQINCSRQAWPGQAEGAVFAQVSCRRACKAHMLSADALIGRSKSSDSPTHHASRNPRPPGALAFCLRYSA